MTKTKILARLHKLKLKPSINSKLIKKWERKLRKMEL